LHPTGVAASNPALAIPLAVRHAYQMAESFLIALREGFEAALIVAIVLAFVRRHAPERARAVWAGTVAALLVSAAVGLVLHVTVDGLEGLARLRTFAAICLAAAALLTWMIFWMRGHARSLKGSLEGRAGHAIAAGSATTLALVAFSAVLREGLETALFLLSTTATSGGGQVVAGTILGLAVATGLGALVYLGSHRLNMRRFFQVTGVLVVIFAAGLLAKAVLFLQSAGDLGTVDNAVYDLTGHAWLTIDTQSGRFLAGIFGWDPRPSFEQVVVWIDYVVPALFLFFKAPKPSTAASAAPAPAEVPVESVADGRGARAEVGATAR
jgi:high-affinity iron transporter